MKLLRRNKFHYYRRDLDSGTLLLYFTQTFTETLVLEFNNRLVDVSKTSHSQQIMVIEALLGLKKKLDICLTYISMNHHENL